MELLLIMLLAGGSGAVPVIGVPHGPDVGLQSAAPSECLIYASYGGIARPDPYSDNQVEALFGEPEIKDFVGEVSRLVDLGIEEIPANSDQERTLKRALPVIGRTLLMRPSMLYVSKVSVPPNLPGGNGAIVVSAADQADKLQDALEELERLLIDELQSGSVRVEELDDGTKVRNLPLPPGAPPVAWGVKDGYVFLAIGDGEAARVVERLTVAKGAPEWLVDLNKELNIKRPSLTVYFNAAEALRVVEPLAAVAAAEAPPPFQNIAKMIDISGLRHLRHIAIGTGLDEQMAVSKLSVAHDGNPEGLLKLTQMPPLTVLDLETVPRNADFASVGRFDAKAAYDVILGMVEQVEPRAGESWRHELGRAEEQLGFSVEHDLLEGLGDTWTIYSSSEEGGLLLTGLCASVTVRDRAKVERVINRTLRLAEREGGRDGKPPFAVRTTKVNDKTITYVQILAEPVPIAPAWYLTDDRLVVALSPQMVRAHISRPMMAESLAAAPEVQRLLGTADVTGVSYANSQFILKAGYSIAQYFATSGASALEKETGIQADLSKFPSLASISRHMRPTVSVTRSTKTGLLMETYSTGPGIGGGAIALVTLGSTLAVPVYHARGAAEASRFEAEQRILELQQRELELRAPPAAPIPNAPPQPKP